jgi:hypothetical protein
VLPLGAVFLDWTGHHVPPHNLAQAVANGMKTNAASQTIDAMAASTAIASRFFRDCGVMMASIDAHFRVQRLPGRYRARRARFQLKR